MKEKKKVVIQIQNISKGFGLLYEMGCGKTLTAIAIMGALYERGKIGKVLIVAPGSVCSVWPNELKEYADFKYQAALLLGEKKKRLEALGKLAASTQGSLKVAVINYESTFREGLEEAIDAWAPDMIIADESQRIKNPSAKQSKALHHFGDNAKYKLILTGTPVQNNAADFYSQYRFLEPSIFGLNYYAFRGRYCLMGGFNNKQIVGYKNKDELIRRAHSAAYRVTKEECLDLPEQTFIDLEVDFKASERKLYDQLRKASIAELESGDTVTATIVLTKLLRLQQFTGGFLAGDKDGKVEQVSRAKLDALAELLDDYCIDGGKKMVVFARFRAEIFAIEKLLKDKGIRFGLIYGDIPMSERDEVVQDFQHNPETKVFLAQLATANFGITLHAASTAVFYSWDYNYAAYQQATARIHRIGQKQPCTYIHLVVKDSIDAKVLKALKAKEDLATSVVDNWRDYF